MSPRAFADGMAAISGTGAGAVAAGDNSGAGTAAAAGAASVFLDTAVRLTFVASTVIGGSASLEGGVVGAGTACPDVGGV